MQGEGCGVRGGEKGGTGLVRNGGVREMSEEGRGGKGREGEKEGRQKGQDWRKAVKEPEVEDASASETWV